MGTYSFLNFQLSIVGPGLNAVLGQGTPGAIGGAQIGSNSGAAKEGVSVAFDEDKIGVVTGADGSIMTSLHATQTGTITVRLLKTSPINAVLSQAYNFQRQSSGSTGQNVIRGVDKVRGDTVSGVQMGFVRFPDNEWGEEGNTLVWTFKGIVRESLGVGVPDVSTP
jgi:hypothetical protein